MYTCTKPSLYLSVLAAIFIASSSTNALNLILTNDDGWAEMNIRAQNDALIEAGHKVVLSAPAENKSGTGSDSATPTVLTEPCEFDTCPTGSPAVGYNASNPLLNYVNAYPVDAARYGIQNLSAKFFDSKPDFVVSGFNVGLNTGSTTQISGTVGAASEAAKEGIPSVAVSGATGSQTSYTELEDATSSATIAARIYANLTLPILAPIFAAGVPYLPPLISLNINYASISSSCASTSDFKYVLTRIEADSSATDVETCGTDHLPAEGTVVDARCYATISVFNATDKADVDASTQAVVLNKLKGILSCYDG